MRSGFYMETASLAQKIAYPEYLFEEEAISMAYRKYQLIF